jgi:hypothetical protein
MRSYQDGQWLVTTPIYIGSTYEVEKAAACAHKGFEETLRTEREGRLLVAERCRECIATRVRYRLVLPEALGAHGSENR